MGGGGVGTRVGHADPRLITGECGWWRGGWAVGGGEG